MAAEHQLTEERLGRERQALELQRQKEESAVAAKHKEAQMALDAEKALAEERQRQATEREAALLEMRRQAETSLLAEKAEIEAKVAERKALAEATARAALERENEELHARARLQQGGLDQEKAVEVAQTSLRLVGDGFFSLLSDPIASGRAVLLVFGCAAAVFGSREGFKLLRSRLEAILGRPALVRETSRKGFALKERLVSLFKGKDAILTDVVFEEGLETRLQQLATATANTRRHQAPFRHVMFYGPPGAGEDASIVLDYP